MNGIYDVYVDENEKLFQKVLKNIVNNDIHSDSLGCAVRDTHIRVSDYHLSTFYQAEILFGNLFWTRLLSDWLCEKICSENSESRDIILIGYEAYTGLLLHNTKEKINQLKESGEITFSCSSVHTFEEKNYNLATYSETDNHFHPSVDTEGLKNEFVVFICGVGLTAKTHKRMENTLNSRINSLPKKKAEETNQNCKKSFYTLIQVFPDNIDLFKKEFSVPGPLMPTTDDNIREIIENKKVFKSSKNNIEITFCVSTESQWNTFETCPKCLTDIYSEEKTLIETNGIPIIPLQQIGPAKNIKRIRKNIKYNRRIIDIGNLSKIRVNTLYDNPDKKTDIIDEENENKIFGGVYKLLKDLKKEDIDKVLRYGHINMNGHHYQYFFKTDMLAEVLNCQIEHELRSFEKNVKKIEEKNPEFIKEKNRYSLGYYNNNKTYSREAFAYLPKLRSIVWMIRKLINPEKDEDLYVIVAPNHYGNSLFPIMVNKYIFGNKAQIIGFDSRKMFRSNFLVEFSNYSLFDAFARHKTHYFFVDDEIIDGKTYERTKSLMRSLIEKNNKLLPSKEPFEFDGCITLMNRQSENAIASFDNNDKYFYFYAGYTPTLKFHDDLCPLCKESEEYKLNIPKTALSVTSNYWKREFVRHNWRILSSADYDQDRDRTNSRFLIEEEIYFKLSTGIDIKVFLDEELEGLKNSIEKADFDANRLISIIKAITKPYLSFKENVRDEALIFAKEIYMLIINTTFSITEKSDVESIEKAKKIWHLLVSVLKALGRMGSNSLLETENILKTYEKLKELFIVCEGLEDSTENENQVSIYCVYVLLGNIKRVLNGVDGKNKSIYFSKKVFEKITSIADKTKDDNWYLLLSLYLESNINIYDEIERMNSSCSSTDKKIEKAYEFKVWLNDQLACLENESTSNNKAFNNCIDCFVQSSTIDKIDKVSLSPLFHYMLENKMPEYVGRNYFDLSDRLELKEADYGTLDGLGIYRESKTNSSNSQSVEGLYYWIKIDEESTLDTVKGFVDELIQNIKSGNRSKAEEIAKKLIQFYYKPNFNLIDKRQYKRITFNILEHINNQSAEETINLEIDELITIVDKTVEREERSILNRGIKNVFIVIDVEKFLDTVNAPKKDELEFINYLQSFLSINYHDLCLKYLNNKVIDKYTQSISFQKALTMSKASYHDIRKHLMERSAVTALENLETFDLFKIISDKKSDDKGNEKEETTLYLTKETSCGEKNTKESAETPSTDKKSCDEENVKEKTKLILTDNYCILVNQLIVTLFRWISVNGDTAVEARKRDLFADAVIDPALFDEGKAEMIYAYAKDDQEVKTIKIIISVEKSLIEKRAIFRKLEDEFLLSTTFPGRGILLALILNTISHSLNHASNKHKDTMKVRMFRDEEMWCIACEQLSETDLEADVENAKKYLEVSPALRGNFFGDGITLWSLKKYFDCLNRNKKGEGEEKKENFILDYDDKENEFIVKMRCLYEEVKK